MRRDPIEEQGGLNLYGFINNNVINRQDKLGLVDPFQKNPFHSDPFFWPKENPGVITITWEDGTITYPEQETECCGNSRYDPLISCCENDKVVEKESIWVCRRRLLHPDSNIPRIGSLSHTFIVCEDPKINPKTTLKFGKQPRPNNTGSRFRGPGFIEVENPEWEVNSENCIEKKVCPADKERMCKEGYTESSYILFSPWHNCHGWANCRSK